MPQATIHDSRQYSNDDILDFMRMLEAEHKRLNAAKKALYDTIDVANAVPAAIDQLLNNGEFNFAPIFSATDSFEGAMEKFLRLRDVNPA